MLKTSIISLGLLLGATTLASAQTYYYGPPNFDPNFYGATQQDEPLYEGRSVYVDPPTVFTYAPDYRMGSFSRETRREQQELNAPAH